MTKQVLDVGQCAADHRGITRLLQTHFARRAEKISGPPMTIQLTLKVTQLLHYRQRSDGPTGELST